MNRTHSRRAPLATLCAALIALALPLAGANAEYLAARLPTSGLVLVEAGHFVWEEAPTAYASLILDAMTGTWT